MSATKAMAKWCLAATEADLEARLAYLREQRETTCNPMVRSSLSSQIGIVEAAIKRRELPNPQ